MPKKSSEGVIEARDISNVPSNLHKLPGDRFFQIECVDCDAVQTFMLRDDKLSLVKCVHRIRS